MTTATQSPSAFTMNCVEFRCTELDGYLTWEGSRDGVDYTLDMQPGGGYSYCVSVDAQGAGDEGPFSLEEAARLATQSSPLGKLLDEADTFTLTVEELRAHLKDSTSPFAKGYLSALIHLKEQLLWTTYGQSRNTNFIVKESFSNS
jgi:hypothetical protein